MAAAIYAPRKNLSTLIVSLDLGGQVGTTYEVANYPGFQLLTGRSSCPPVQTACKLVD